MAIFTTPAPNAVPDVALTQALNATGVGGTNLAAFKVLAPTDYAHVVVSHAAAMNGQSPASGTLRAGIGVIVDNVIYGVMVGMGGEVYHVSATVDLSGLSPTYTLYAPSPNTIHHLCVFRSGVDAIYPFQVDHTLPMPYTIGLDPFVGSSATICILLETNSTGSGANIQEIVIGDTLYDNLVTVDNGQYTNRSSTNTRMKDGSRVYINLWGTHQDRAVELSGTGSPQPGLEPVNATKILYRDRVTISNTATISLVDVPPYDQNDYLASAGYGYHVGTGQVAWDHAFMVSQGSNLYHDSGSTFYVSEDGYLFYIDDDSLGSSNPRQARAWQYTDLKPYLADPLATPAYNCRNGFFSALGDNSDLVMQWGNGIFSLSGTTPALIQDGSVDTLSQSQGGGRAGGWYLAFRTGGDNVRLINDSLGHDYRISEVDGAMGSFCNVVYNSGYFITARLRWPGSPSTTDMYESIWGWDFSTPGDPNAVEPTFAFNFDYYPVHMETHDDLVLICGGLGGGGGDLFGYLQTQLHDIPANNPTTGPSYVCHTTANVGVISFYDPNGGMADYRFPGQSVIRFNRVKELTGAVEGLPAGWYASSLSTGTQTGFDPIVSDPNGILSGEISAVDFSGSTLSPLIRLDPGQLDAFEILGRDVGTAIPHYHYYLPLDFCESGNALAISATFGNGVFVYPPLTYSTLSSGSLGVVTMGWEYN